MLAIGMNGEPLPGRARLPGPHGHPRAVRLRVGLQVADPHRGDDVRRLRRLLGRARLGRRGADQGRLPHRHPRAAALVPRRPPGHRRRRLGADPRHRPRRGAGRRRGLGSRPSSRPTVDADIWRQWVLPYDFAAGRHTAHRPRDDAPTARCRPTHRADPFPAGASGWHTIAGARQLTAHRPDPSRQLPTSPRDNAVARTRQGAPPREEHPSHPRRPHRRASPASRSR